MSNIHFFELYDHLPSTSKPTYPRQNFAMGRHKDKKYRNSEYDDCTPLSSKSAYPRQNFSMGKHKDKKYRNSVGKLHMEDPEGDVNMGGPPRNFDRRFDPYHGQKNNRKKNKKGPKHDNYPWYKIIIPHGKLLGKDFILNAISSLVKTTFTPYNFQFNKNNAEFYVYGYPEASQVKETNRKVTSPKGFKMAVMIYNVNSPAMPCIDPSVIEIIKTAMSAHYNPERHSLNLTEFHEVNTLKMQGLYIPLNKPLVFQPVMKVIKENIPEIEILNLTQNNLYNLEAASILVPVCKQLKSINFQNNKLRSISELNFLKGLDLKELVLDGNPLCDDFDDHASYISAVRERFPKLIRLDGHDLPAPIGFDLGSETLPVSKKSFFAADDVKELVVQFLQAYYPLYDSGERMQLLDAYHEQAAFSLCLSKNTSNKSGPGSLATYSMDNRNLLKTFAKRERYRLLKQGKHNIVCALQELPQTMHDLSSFSVDIFHVSPVLMSFSVTGVFKEVGAEINSATLKTFSRTFVVVPHNTGFVIVNETLFMANASTEQQQKAFKVPAPTPSPSPAPPVEEKSVHEKKILVTELSKQSGMNEFFSSKCLEENDWDYSKALAVFMAFQNEGRLPPEAFVH